MKRRGRRLTTVAGSVALLVLCTPPAGAQNRTATLRARATIVGAAGSDLLAAEAVARAASPRAASPAGAATTRDVWRITGGRNQQLSIQVERGSGAAGALPAEVAICELIDDTTDGECAERDRSSVRVTTAGVRPEVRVRAGRVSGTASSDAPVLITIAYITG